MNLFCPNELNYPVLQFNFPNKNFDHQIQLFCNAVRTTAIKHTIKHTTFYCIFCCMFYCMFYRRGSAHLQ